MSHPDLTRGHALLCHGETEADDQARALARILARLGAGEDTAAQARHERGPELIREDRP